MVNSARQCDKCSANAQIVVTAPYAADDEDKLFYCAHHYAQAPDSIRELDHLDYRSQDIPTVSRDVPGEPQITSGDVPGCYASEPAVPDFVMLPENVVNAAYDVDAMMSELYADIDCQLQYAGNRIVAHDAEILAGIESLLADAARDE